MSDLDSKLDSITWVDNFKAFFVRNKHAYWWNHFTDEEKYLRRMDVWQLADIIQPHDKRTLVAEYMLRERIAELQARPVWWSIFAALLGVIGGAFLTTTLQKNDHEVQCKCECGARAENEQGPKESIENTPPISKSVIKPPDGEKKSGQDGAYKKP